jgi:Subtilase family
VRVLISLATNPVRQAAGSPRVSFALSGRLTRAEAAAFSRRPRVGPALASQHMQARAAALRRLSAAAADAGKQQNLLARALARLGGRVVGVDPLSNSLTAIVPRKVLTRLAARADVWSINPAPVQRAMGALADATAAVGAPTWWAAGYKGGSGVAPDGTGSLAILSDKIEEDQPLFQGVSFERPSTTPQNPPCGQASAGCEHGTEVAGMAVAVGNSTCATLCDADSGIEKGVAYGVKYVLDASFLGAPDGNFNSIAWALGITQRGIYPNTGTMPGASHPAQVMSDSHGSYTTSDDSTVQQNADALVDQQGVTLTEPSGNDGLNGTGSGHITETCIAYNVICAGGIGYTDDAVSNFASQGPSPAGRKKPDIVAIASGTGDGANMTVVEQRYSYYSRLERGDTGTSFASPQVAGAAQVLYSSGLTSPLAQKALLIDSATLGRATLASAMGTQTGWQQDWGWGELNLDAAYQQRANTNGGAESVGAQDVRFYRATVVSGDRATLVWNRRSIGCWTAGCGSPHAFTLSNLNLYQYDQPSQTLQDSSESSIDNVEQVRGTGSGPVIYKIRDASSSVDGASAEPFALAAKNSLTALTAPKPTARLDLDRSSARQGDPVTVTATLTNTSSNMDGSSAQLTLNVPTGVQVVSGGSTTWQPGTLAQGSAPTHTWTVKGTQDGVAQLTATASDQGYGETFNAAQASASLRIDSKPPSPMISCPLGTTTEATLPVSWGGSDASGIATYDVLVGVDGGALLPWLTGVTNTAATYGGQVGHSYRFAVRATDLLGNGSAELACDPTTVQPAKGPPVLPPPPTVGTPLPSPPRLKISSAAVSGSQLTASGSLAADATGTVRVTYTAHGRTVRGSARVRRGRFRLTLRLDRTQRHKAGGVLRISYSGDAHHSAQRIVRRIRR